MRIADPAVKRVANESEILEELLHLQGAVVLELGCGKAEKTRFIAKQAASILALEVDEQQLAKNLAITDLPNVRFAHGGAEKTSEADVSFDIVLMFKSLHHVPIDLMDSAFAEIKRVLKPGGVAYISEPVYAGDFNDILKLFHDENVVRTAAFAAVQRAVAAGQLTLESQTFFLQPMPFTDFAHYEEQVLKVTHTDHKLADDIYEKVRTKFNAHMRSEGTIFHMPIRVDLLRKVQEN